MDGNSKTIEVCGVEFSAEDVVTVIIEKNGRQIQIGPEADSPPKQQEPQSGRIGF